MHIAATTVPKFSAGKELKDVISGAKKLPKLTIAAVQGVEDAGLKALGMDHGDPTVVDAFGLAGFVFLFFPILGFSVNVLTLFGLVLAIGIVVDDAIVVVEAVEHHIEHGLEPREVGREMWRGRRGSRGADPAARPVCRASRHVRTPSP